MNITDIKRELKNSGFNDLSNDDLEEFMTFLHSELKEKDEKNQKKKINKIDENEKWSKLIKDWTIKVKELDEKLKETSEITSKKSKSKPKSFKYNFEDPYPILNPESTGRGFIKPPQLHNAFRKRFPIYKSEVCYPSPDFIKDVKKKKFQPHNYIPGNSQRQDKMRWELRERITYSHPDYYIRSNC